MSDGELGAFLWGLSLALFLCTVLLAAVQARKARRSRIEELIEDPQDPGPRQDCEITLASGQRLTGTNWSRAELQRFIDICCAGGYYSERQHNGENQFTINTIYVATIEWPKGRKETDAQEHGDTPEAPQRPEPTPSRPDPGERAS